MDVAGTHLLGFSSACKNLGYFIDNVLFLEISRLEPSGWYPLELLFRLEEEVRRAYSRPASVFHRIGEEMMQVWYREHNGEARPSQGAEFLEFQRDSLGYLSTLRGEPEALGAFALETHDPEAGRAAVISTTPFSKDMEEGILYGGLLTPGDLSWVKILRDGYRFFVEYG